MEKLIPLSDIYFIGADKYNWILYKKCKKQKSGEIYYSGEKFYPTLESLLSNFAEMKCRCVKYSTTDLISLANKMSAERKKWLKEACKSFESIKKEDLYE